jgi:hypothetical protein
MRFARRGDSDRYVALCSHPLEDSEDDGGDFSSPTINTAQLDGIPSCPHCESPGACMCECGTLFCIDGSSASVVCPHCHESGYLGAGRGFDIRQAEG